LELHVNPTRMELGKLKKRLQVAKRGHKLLKDKLEEMMKQFLGLVEENRHLRETVEESLSEVFKGFLLARAQMSPEFLTGAIAYSKHKLTLEAGIQRRMGLEVPSFKITSAVEAGKGLPYGLAQTSSELDQAILLLLDSFGPLLELSEVEKAVELMAAEIEKTRRRVNALEFVLIPQLEETIRFITMKLEENERSTLTRLMKVKDIVRGRDL